MQKGWYFLEVLQVDALKLFQITESVIHVKTYDSVKQWQNFSSNLNWIFISSLIIWQLSITPTALSWISKHVYWTINCQQSHTKWNIHFKWLLSSVYWNFNTSQNQTLLPLLHNTALSGYKNSLIEYMPTCAKKLLLAITLLYCHTTHKGGKKKIKLAWLQHNIEAFLSTFFFLNQNKSAKCNT